MILSHGNWGGGAFLIVSDGPSKEVITPRSKSQTRLDHTLGWNSIVGC